MSVEAEVYDEMELTQSSHFATAAFITHHRMCLLQGAECLYLWVHQCAYQQKSHQQMDTVLQRQTG
jgi:hypothetical protein